jgi:riboflavin kinase/FMN adenylyltransferase
MNDRPITRIETLVDFPEALRGSVLAIGNFDGVHRGHQAVLNDALRCRVSGSMPATALTFEPHPRTVFQPDNPVFRLTPPALKAKLIGAMGFAAIIELPFTREFAQNSAAAFVEDVLVGSLGISHIVTGFNFHFGKARQGSPDYLREVGGQYKFGVTVVEPFKDEDTALVSSSRIRACLSAGDVVEAAGLLGYRYSVEAEVIRGKQLGRTLGFPTANMALPPQADLRPGIYAVRFRRADGTIHDGVASFGRRPTVDDDGPILLETFVFDFDQDLYGEVCSVSFFAHLRDEVKFDGLEPLMQQMKRDAEEARAVLSGVQPFGPLDHVLAFG